MISMKSRKRAALTLSVIMMLSLVFGVNALAADANPRFEAPNNGQPYAFSVPFQVNESQPYAGIQFELALSDPNCLSFSFTLGDAVKGASIYPPPTSSNLHNEFGFVNMGSNAYSGDLLVGELNITYTGSEPQAITIAEMKIVRIKEDGKTTEGIIKPSPVQIISVSRAGSEPYYTVTFDTAGGVRTGGGALIQTVAENGAAVAPTVTRSGYTFSGWDKTFNNVTSDMIVTAQWTPSGGPGGQTPGDSGGETVGDTKPPQDGGFPFDDVHEGDWFYDDVVYVYENDLMTGTGATKFSPNMSLTRGMIVTILGRQADADQSKYPSCAFSDVDNKIYYAPYIEWGRQNGIVLGVGSNKFEPDRAVTRQELAAILHRYTDFAEFTLPVTRPYTQFLDEKDIAAYAKDPVQALFSAGVINGKPGNLFDPTGTATRAEAAAMLHRFLVAAGV